MSSSSTSDDPTWVAWKNLAETTVRLFYDLPELFVMKALLHAPRRRSIYTGQLCPEQQELALIIVPEPSTSILPKSCVAFFSRFGVVMSMPRT